MGHVYYGNNYDWEKNYKKSWLKYNFKFCLSMFWSLKLCLWSTCKVWIALFWIRSDVWSIDTYAGKFTPAFFSVHEIKQCSLRPATRKNTLFQGQKQWQKNQLYQECNMTYVTKFKNTSIWRKIYFWPPLPF